MVPTIYDVPNWQVLLQNLTPMSEMIKLRNHEHDDLVQVVLTLCYFMAFAAMWPTLIFLLFLIESISCHSVLRILPVQKEAIMVEHAVVATDDGRCSRIGSRILRKGGHAVAAAFCLGVVSPASSGIGGGAFMLVRSADGHVQGYDMRETAPSNASRVRE
ncbi:hypothetical protein AMTR_s00056p00016650 [Amborella trichopoda]|uniref:Gamma-glutamyltranspeptidase n=1 Tax=Amborella trichopoda TaxID=13333 RepID=U5CPH4_AMBTC|nr:hypothetical protein AMTR_s00056p00016650 [Amborella trichopoda]